MPPIDDDRAATLRALEAGIVARLHQVSRLVAAVERGHDRAGATVMLAFALAELAALQLALLEEQRKG